MVDFRDPKTEEFSTFRNGSDTLTLRKALGKFATGVTIVTSLCENQKPQGLTINSFTSVSLDPPLVLICLSKEGGTLRHILNFGKFVINILGASQSDISKTFATHNIDRFANTKWHAGENACPLIDGAIANFECDVFNAHSEGDHRIIIGKVTKACFENKNNPLLYYSGGYKEIKK